MNQAQQIAMIVAQRRALYDKPPLANEVLAAYALMLKDMSPADVESAFQAHETSEEGRFWPHPGQLFRLHRLANLPSVSPEAAFDEVVSAYTRGVQPNGDPYGARYVDEDKRDRRMMRILHPVVFAAFMRRRGWRWIASLDEGQYRYERNSFAEIVRDELEKAEAQIGHAQITGSELPALGDRLKAIK